MALTDQELSSRVDRMLAIRAVANEYSRVRSEIKDELIARHADHFVAPSGAFARLKKKPSFEWLKDKLFTLFGKNKELYERLCPRQADAKALDAYLAALPAEHPERARLMACRRQGADRVELEVEND